MAEGEKLIPINIEDEMKSAYIDYSMSVIVSRALPDVRDGLKPVHRRVLFGMHELGIRSNTAYKKSARIVGGGIAGGAGGTIPASSPIRLVVFDRVARNEGGSIDGLLAGTVLT